MKFCPVVPEICRGQVHGPRKKKKKKKKKKKNKNNNKKQSKNNWLGDLMNTYQLCK